MWGLQEQMGFLHCLAKKHYSPFRAIGQQTAALLQLEQNGWTSPEKAPSRQLNSFRAEPGFERLKPCSLQAGLPEPNQLRQLQHPPSNWAQRFCGKRLRAQPRCQGLDGQHADGQRNSAGHVVNVSANSFAPQRQRATILRTLVQFACLQFARSRDRTPHLTATSWSRSQLQQQHANW